MPKSGTAQFAAAARFYDFVDDKGVIRFLEYFLGRLEAKASAIIAGILEKQLIARLTKGDRMRLSLFAANPPSRFVISATADFGLAKEMVRRNATLKEPPGFIVS